MGFIYQEANAYGVEALVALERHYTPTEEKYCTAVTEAVRICDTYGIPERELVPQVRHIAAAEDAHELRPRLAFCLLSTQLLMRLAALHKAEAAFTMDDFCELSRMYSSEIEYSQENMDALLDALWYV